MFQYYFTVSEKFFPPLCLHALLLTCISSSFFRFLPVSSRRNWKKYLFSSFFHSSRKKPVFPEVSEPWPTLNTQHISKTIATALPIYWSLDLLAFLETEAYCPHIMLVTCSYICTYTPAYLSPVHFKVECSKFCTDFTVLRRIHKLHT